MIRLLVLAFFSLIAATLSASAESKKPANPPDRRAAEYYISMYARHYHVPVPLVRAIVQRESNWQPYAVSAKGAKGLMQLMPATARRLGVRDSCSIEQNISGGVRYLAWLMRLFHNDLRLVAAGYYAGEDIVARRGLSYHNRDVVSYVARIRATYVLQAGVTDDFGKTTSKRVMR
ncbi:MAG TPA: lytic transglycosylase domain-containing protein [Terriglobales bacterium]|nr:lytic transglycosylase domain-containing protein [Terriglobales bacterium]